MLPQMFYLGVNHEGDTLSANPSASQTIAPSVATTLPTNEIQRAASPPPQSLLSQTSASSSNVSNTSQFLLPIPTPSVNKSQASFVYPDSIDSDSESSSIGPLPPEIASADISIAPDGSFVETSSAPAARELKRRYDRHIGVGKDVRSPYAITAFVNQHGKQLFRVGKRDLAAVGVEADRSSSNVYDAERLQAPRPKRRSRMSVQVFVPPSLKSATTTQQTLTSANGPTDTNAPRKLRKTRSIPESLNGSSYSLSSAYQQGPGSATGRAHSQSVTSADMPRLPAAMVDVARPPNGDIFGDVMRWNVGATTSSPFPSGSGSARLARSHMWSGEAQDHVHTSAVILEPFGSNVSFDSPAIKPDADFLPMPRSLREVQSFESGLTARASDQESRAGGKPDSPSFTPLEPFVEDQSSELTPHASFNPVIGDHTIEPEPEPEPATEPPDTPDFALLPETSMHSRYSTDVFDVLQTYRGLPLLDRMDDNTVIRMSYRPDNTATPRDDPRFVLWGETMDRPESDDLSVSHGSRTEFSSTHSSHASRRKGSKSGKSASISADLPKVRVSPEESTRKVIIAATIERWIAQLTSDLNYDELLNFFLTYRTYINALDLCHLLICRFHWALGKHNSSQDKTARQIVRVRTFVAIRYWLLTFFNVDFLPNRELRLSLASWLNALIRDPILKSHSDGLIIVRKLIKVVKDCKEAHTRKGRSPNQSPSKTSKLRSTVSHVLGDKFAEATYKEEDSDVDLDFLPDQGGFSCQLGGFQSDLANAHLSAVHDGSGLSLPPKPTHVPSVSAAILQQPLPVNILQHSRVLASGARVDLPFLQSPSSLPIHNNTLSRAFVKTIGRLGRWKRVLNSRQAVHRPPGTSTDVSAFDLELNAEGDLLAVRGGVEQYLKIIERQQPVVNVPTALPSHPQPELPSRPPSNGQQSCVSSQAPPLSDARSSTVVGDDMPPQAPLDCVNDGLVETVGVGVEQPDLAAEASEEVSTASHKLGPVASPAKTFKKQRVRSDSGSSSDSSFGSPIRSRSRPTSVVNQIPPRNPWGFEVMSIDDLDLSDTSSDFHGIPVVPSGLKKPSRKLPLRRDFEFVRRSRDSVSSMGIISRQSVISEPSVVSGGEPEIGGGGIFQQWQLNAIVDSLSDTEESGDIEAALRRLEGQINPQKQQEKVSKVDGWVKTIQERMAAGDYSDEPPRFFDEEGAEDGEPDIDDDDESARWSSYNDGLDASFPAGSISQGPSSHTSQESVVLATTLKVMSGPLPNVTGPGPTSPQRSFEAKPVVEDAVPLEILQSRVSSEPSTSQVPLNTPISSLTRPIVLGPGISKLGNSNLPRAYRSWVLSHKAHTVVEHFSMIDRELFMGVKFEELVLDDWTICDEANILDWAQFLKDRARWKAESRCTHKTSALAAVRARFNLVANFTLSEVVLTHPSERLLVMKKFIRIAWKAYNMSNYNTLIAVMAGLQSEWVTKVMRNAWGRLGGWEKRVYDDLQAWTDAKDDFKFVRQAVTAMIDAKPLNAGTASVISTSATDGQSSKSKTTADGKPQASTACVPFIGVYLSQLYRHSKLPDLIDPTAPNEAVRVDPLTGNFDPLAHPEVFSDLAPTPPSVQLEPLINVHKQRLIADVIKMLVAGQHLASRVQYPVDKKLFQKCLKLRGLDSATLQRAQEMYR